MKKAINLLGTQGVSNFRFQLCAIAIIAMIGFSFTTCGDPDGGSTGNPAHTHQWGEWTVTTAPTCTATGAKTRVCTLDATHTETETIVIDLVNGHDWEWVITITPTYFIQGVETGTCKHDPSHTDTRPVQTNQYITSLAGVTEYLASQTGTVESPVFLPLQIDLGTVTDVDNGWLQMMDALETAGKFVDLDLSTCTINGTLFDPGWEDQTGRDKIVSLALPEGITSIGEGAFYGYTTLTQVILPDGLTTIGDESFYECTALTQITLPDSLTTIDNSAFYGCTALTQITLPDSLTTDTYAFYGCTGLTQVTLSASFTSINTSSFVGCTSLVFTLTGTGPLSTIEGGKVLVRDGTVLVAYPSASGNITLPAGLTSIGERAFFLNTSLTQITLPAGLSSIGDDAFQQCSGLTQITLPAGLSSIGNRAFYLCRSLTQINLHEGIFSIGHSSFLDCRSLNQITLPEGITSIEESTFMYCASLTQITLPSSLTSIGGYAFYNCTNLALVTCLAETPPEVGRIVFYDNHATLRIEVPAGSVAAYKANENWREYASRIFAIEE